MGVSRFHLDAFYLVEMLCIRYFRGRTTLNEKPNNMKISTLFGAWFYFSFFIFILFKLEGNI